MAQKLICIVDDEEIIRISLKDDLKDAGYAVKEYSDPRRLLNDIKRTVPDLILTDIKMPGVTGIDLLDRVKALRPEVPVIMMTAYGSVQSAVDAMKKGAYDYLTKPFEIDEMLLVIERGIEMHGVRRANRRMRKQLSTGKDQASFVGSSEHANQIRQLIDTVAPTNTTVLITGETGTGKELVSDIVHYSSNREGGPYIKVSCAVLAREVFESELFGHRKGAFTGAENSRTGRFLNADGGTIFLDDIDDIPLDMQVKLLRVIEERSIEQVGSSAPRSIDVRIIASTKADLRVLAAEGKFREDLLYRVNVFPIHIPPLRTRSDDIPALIDHFLRVLNGKRSLTFAPDTIGRLMDYAWPGNIRELRNVIERLLLLSDEDVIGVHRLPPEISSPEPHAPAEVGFRNESLDAVVAHIERTMIVRALEEAGGNQVKAASALQVPPSTLRSKLAKYQLR